MIRFLVDAHVFDGKFQGTRTYIQGLYQSLIKYKDIDFYFAAQDVDNLKKYFGNNSNIHYISLKTGSSIKRLVIEFPKIIKEYKIDFAHYQYISPLTKCCKEIVTVHDLLFLDYPKYFSWSYKLKNGFLFKRSAKRADILLTVSEYSKEAISRIFKISRDEIFLTPNAVLPVDDNLVIPNVRERFGLDKFILTVSRIEPRKNHLMLLKAFNDLNLAAKGYKLVMVGVPDLKYKEFSDYYDTLEPLVKDAVIMKPFPFPDLVGLYQQASLFVFPSFAEGFGIPPLEALEYGCPILCSHATAMAEFQFPKEWTFDPYDEKELKQKMSFLLQYRPNLKEEKEFLKKKFNWDVIADGFYQEIKKHI